MSDHTPSESRHIRLIVLYLAVSFVVAWSCWGAVWLHANGHLPGLPLMPVLIAGSFGPFAAAFLCTTAEGGLGNMLRFFGGAFNIFMGWRVFLLSVFLMPALALATEAVHVALRHVPFETQATWSDLPMTYVWLLFLGGAVAEEFGWSYLSNLFDRFFPASISTLLLGAIWACWHLPLFFIIAPGLIQYYTPFLIFFIGTVSMRFLFSWTYHRSGNNILSNILFHNSSNLAYSIVLIAPTPAEPGLGRLWCFTLLTLAAAAVLWLRHPIRAGEEIELPVAA